MAVQLVLQLQDPRFGAGKGAGIFNNVMPRFDGDGLRVINYSPDVTPPATISFTVLDIDAGFLRIRAEEPLSDDVALTNLTLQQTMTGGINYTLTGGQSITYLNDLDRREIEITLNDIDLQSVKLMENLASSALNSYLSILADAITDTADNKAGAVPPSMALLVDMFVDDTTPPRLSSFDLDMDMGILTLNFDDIVDTSSLDTTKLTFLPNTNTSSPAAYQLTAGTSVSTNGYEVVIMLSTLDFNSIKSNTAIASNVNNTYISITPELIRDVSESRHGVISVEQQVANFIPDNSLPSLVAFTLDVNTGVLTMSFTEAVEQSSFNVSEIKLQSDTILTDSLDLTGGNISTSQANRIFIITLTATDLNSLKEKLNLATNINNTYISFTDRLAKDFNGLPIVEIDPEDAVRAADHAIDLTAPTLSAFTFDADTGTLVITFSETVSGSTLLVNRFILQSDPLSFTGVSYQLQAGSHSTAESRVVSIIVSSQDLNKIKELEMLATSQANTYLRNNMGAVEDTTGVTIAALADGSAIQASNYTQDDTPPELTDFYLRS